jgi:hypothetical protein
MKTYEDAVKFLGEKSKTINGSIYIEDCELVAFIFDVDKYKVFNDVAKYEEVKNA